MLSFSFLKKPQWVDDISLWFYGERPAEPDLEPELEPEPVNVRTPNPCEHNGSSHNAAISEPVDNGESKVPEPSSCLRERLKRFIKHLLGEKNHSFFRFFLFNEKEQLIKGETQSGKTNAMLCAALLEVTLRKRNVIMVLRNVKCDALQLAKNARTFHEEWDKFSESCGVSQLDNPAFVTQQITSDLDAQTVISDMTRSSRCPRVFVCICNKTELEKAKSIVLFAKDKGRNFTLIVDEADDLSVNRSTDGINGGKNANTIDLVQELASVAEKTYYVTATDADILGSKRIAPGNRSRIELAPPQDYRGFKDGSINIVHIGQNDPIKETLRKWIHEEPVMRRDERCWIPFIGLISLSTTREKKNMNEVADNCHTQFPKMFTTIVYNGDGCTLNYDGMPDEVSHPCSDGTNVSIYKNKPSSLQISDLLQYLKQNNNGQFPQRIVIVAGGLASRGISFVSADYGWHLRGMLYTPGKRTSLPDIIQKVGRLCGRNKHGAPTVYLYTDAETATKLQTGRECMDEMIKTVDTKHAETGESTGTYVGDFSTIELSKKLKVKGGLNKKVPTLHPGRWVDSENAKKSALSAERKAKLNFFKQMNGEKGRFAKIIMAFEEANWEPLPFDSLKKVCDGSDPMRDFDRNDYEKNRYHIMNKANGNCYITRLGKECWEFWENNKPN
jgi:hypothetical protein